MSDLIQSTKSSVFELLRPPAPTTNNVNNNSDSDNICSRLRSRKRIAQQPRQPQRKKRRTACGGIMNLVQPEDEEEDTEVILNKADEIESLQVGNNRNLKILQPVTEHQFEQEADFTIIITKFVNLSTSINL